MAGRRVNSRRIVPISAVSFDAISPEDNDDLDGIGGDDEFDRQMALDMESFSAGLDDQQGVVAGGAVGSNTARREEKEANRQNAMPDVEGIGMEEQNEEVVLAHDKAGAGKKSIEAMRTAFTNMQKQIEEFKKRAQAAIEKSTEAQRKVFDLEEKIDNQDDEINTLQMQLQTAGNAGPGGMRIIGGGGGGGGAKNKANNANDKLRQELAQSGDANDVDLGLTELDGQVSLLKQFLVWAAKKKPFQKDIRTIQGKFGSAVASYFVFYRFIFMQVCSITVVAAIFLVMHLNLFIGNGNDSFEKLVSGPGMLPAFMLFSTFEKTEAFNYSMFVIFGMLVFFSTAVEHLVTEDKIMKRIDAAEEGNEVPFSKAVLCSWDMGSSGYNPTERQIQDQIGSLGNGYAQILDESRTAGVMKSRSRFELLVLYTRRFVANILYVAVQAGSFASIVILTIYTEAITEALGKTSFKNFASAIAPLALNILNSISPPLMKAITTFERWDSGQMNLNVLLFRMYLSNILNTLILALSYLLLSDPMLLAQFPTVRGSLELTESGLFDCRIDQTADAMFSLYTTNFVIANFSLWAMSFGWKKLHGVLSKSTRIHAVLGDYEPFPFEVEPAMINLFNNMSLVMITFPFAPIALVFLPVAIYITVKVEVYCMVNYFGKPERTWKAHQSGVIFTSFYLSTLLVIGIPITVYFLSSQSFPKECSIQDSSTKLCGSAVNSATSICSFDESSDFYAFYGTDTSTYPANICGQPDKSTCDDLDIGGCKGSCGPFVEFDSNLIAFRDQVFTFDTLKQLWVALFNSSYVSWIIVIYMLVTKWRAKNSKEVLFETEAAKERVLTVQLESLEAEKRRQDKIIIRLKSQQAAAEAAAELRNMQSPRM